MARRSIAVTIAGQEFRVRADREGLDEAWLSEVAQHVDRTMERVRERTGTIDTRDLAILTALNLAREVLSLREQLDGGADGERVLRLAEQIESQLGHSGSA